jgi:hypothetical protein
MSASDIMVRQTSRPHAGYSDGDQTHFEADAAKRKGFHSRTATILPGLRMRLDGLPLLDNADETSGGVSP